MLQQANNFPVLFNPDCLERWLVVVVVVITESIFSFPHAPLHHCGVTMTTEILQTPCCFTHCRFDLFDAATMSKSEQAGGLLSGGQGGCSTLTMTGTDVNGAELTVEC